MKCGEPVPTKTPVSTYSIETYKDRLYAKAGRVTESASSITENAEPIAHQGFEERAFVLSEELLLALEDSTSLIAVVDESARKELEITYVELPKNDTEYHADGELWVSYKDGEPTSVGFVYATGIEYRLRWLDSTYLEEHDASIYEVFTENYAYDYNLVMEDTCLSDQERQMFLDKLSFSFVESLSKRVFDQVVTLWKYDPDIFSLIKDEEARDKYAELFGTAFSEAFIQTFRETGDRMTAIEHGFDAINEKYGTHLEFTPGYRKVTDEELQALREKYDPRSRGRKEKKQTNKEEEPLPKWLIGREVPEFSASSEVQTNLQQVFSILANDLAIRASLNPALIKTMYPTA